MSPEAALRTDHVNLLIHRYLQEAGFENAAKALHVDWQRQPEHRDPENLPFAHTLQRNELISVIQAGLHYDELQARARKTDRKFQWTSTRERTDGYVENGAGSRPSSSGRRKGPTSTVRSSDDFPTPMPKRQRRSEGSDAHINGERSVADGDTADGDGEADAEGEEDVDAASPAVQSEPEAVPTERYDSVMTQTDFKTVPKTSTLSWTIDKPGAKLLEGSWNLGPESRHARTLLAVGDSLCRLYEIPDSMDDPLPVSTFNMEARIRKELHANSHLTQIKSLDEQILPDGSAVTAVAWRADGEAASFALDLSPDSAEESQMSSLSLVERSRDGSSAVFLAAPPMLEPAGIVLSLKYSPGGEYLLAAKTNTNRGLVQVWKTARAEGSEIQMVHEAVAWRIFANPIHDVLWSGDDTFAVSGDAGCSCLYQVDVSQQQVDEAQSTDSIEMRGLKSLNSSIAPADHSWDHIRIDQTHKLAALASIDARSIVLTSRIHSPELPPEADHKIALAENIAALDFKPGHIAADAESVEGDTQSPSLLAVALEEGPCCIYIISRQNDGTITYIEGPSLSLAEGQVTTLAWSTKGDYLAVGNADLVQIWHTNSLKRVDGATALEAYVTWRPASEASGHGPEQNDEERETYQPSLSWSSDDSLAYAADKQVSLVQSLFVMPWYANIASDCNPPLQNTATRNQWSKQSSTLEVQGSRI